jgi:hypothetical protein
MTEPNQGSSEGVERGAAEEATGAPLTETEEQVSQPPQERESDEPAD